MDLALNVIWTITPGSCLKLYWLGVLQFFQFLSKIEFFGLFWDRLGGRFLIQKIPAHILQLILLKKFSCMPLANWHLKEMLFSFFTVQYVKFYYFVFSSDTNQVGAIARTKERKWSCFKAWSLYFFCSFLFFYQVDWNSNLDAACSDRLQ